MNALFKKVALYAAVLSLVGCVSVEKARKDQGAAVTKALTDAQEVDAAVCISAMQDLNDSWMARFCKVVIAEEVRYAGLVHNYRIKVPPECKSHLKKARKKRP